MITGDKYFQVKVLVEYDTGKKLKKVIEYYLIKAFNVTDAEAKLVSEFVKDNVQEDYRITDVKETKILKVIE